VGFVPSAAATIYRCLNLHFCGILSDHTLLEVRTEITGSTDTILWFYLGSKNQPYPGKIEWSELNEKGDLEKKLKITFLQILMMSHDNENTL